jgi:Fe-Mn family superoxide dismutase
MTVSSRRRFIKTAAAASLVAASGASIQPAAAEQKSMSAAAFDSQHAATPPPFDTKGLHGLSERLIQSHWENNYGGAVKALNARRGRLMQALNDPNTPPYVYTGLKREQLLRTGSVVLHEAYFGNLGGPGKPGADLRTRIAG